MDTASVSNSDGEVGKEDSSRGVVNSWNLVAVFSAVMGFLKTKFEQLVMSGWFSWWPFWGENTRLGLLMDAADNNPKDASKQSAFLAELNKKKFDFSLSLS